MSDLTTATPTLAELAAAHQAGATGLSLREIQRRITQLQAVYAQKMQQLEAFEQFFEDSTPDFVLRRADGKELALRLSTQESGTPLASLREGLENELRYLEGEIITAHSDLEIVREEFTDPADPRRAILALCMPAVGQASQPQRDTLPTAA